MTRWKELHETKQNKVGGRISCGTESCHASYPPFQQFYAFLPIVALTKLT